MNKGLIIGGAATLAVIGAAIGAFFICKANKEKDITDTIEDVVSDVKEGATEFAENVADTVSDIAQEV